MKSAAALILFNLYLVLASNHTDDTTNSTSGGLSGGAVAGIVIGVIAFLAIAGFGVYVAMNGVPAALSGVFGGMGGTPAPAATARKLGDNHLPMMAMRVNHDDDL